MKIIDASHAARIAESGATVVSGYFDPLTAPIAERLAAFKKPGTPLLVLINTGTDPILPARARAELVAALSAVDHVCDSPDDAHITAHIHLESEHDAAFAKLVRHVHDRQRGTS